jgi:taurine dioxygenase
LKDSVSFFKWKDVVSAHPLYPHVEGFHNIVLLENDSGAPPDTNSWHTDLTFKAVQPFASVLIARHVPEVGGNTYES